MPSAPPMVPEVAILDAKTIGELPAATGEREAMARRYVRALVTAGPRAYVDNAHAKAWALLVGGKLLPLVVPAERAAGNADVCVPSAHYVSYTIEQLAKRHPRLPRALVPAVTRPLGAALRTERVDHLALVNNWLLPINPAPRPSAAGIAALPARPIAGDPDPAGGFVAVNPRPDPPRAGERPA